MKELNQIILQRLKTSVLKSKEIQDILNKNSEFRFDHTSTRKFMRELEEEMSKDGILIESSLRGYFIPDSPEQAIEGLEFIKKKALSLMKRYNRRLKIYQKIFPSLKQLELFDEKETNDIT